MNTQQGTFKADGVLVSHTFSKGLFAIVRVRVEGRAGLVTMKGNFGNVQPGSRVEVEGVWEQHPKFGAQVSARNIVTKLPASDEGVRAYLSALLPGIGPVRAAQLASAHGEKIWDVLTSKDASKLRAGLSWMNEAQAQEIIRTYDEAKVERELMVWLMGLGLTAHACEKLMTWAEEEGIQKAAIRAKIEEDPFILMEVSGWGWKKADSVRERLGIAKDAPVRLRAGIQHTFTQFEQEGHTAVMREVFIVDPKRGAKGVLGVEEKVIREALTVCEEEGNLYNEMDDEVSPTLQRGALYRAEQLIAKVVAWKLNNR